MGATDIHNNSPGEEINFHGYLNGTKHPNFGTDYGYPNCAAAWHVSDMPRSLSVKVGQQFAYDAGRTLGTGNSCGSHEWDAKITTADCGKYTPPRLTLPSHWAPIDFKFNSKGTVAYMTSRGSW